MSGFFAQSLHLASAPLCVLLRVCFPLLPSLSPCISYLGNPRVGPPACLFWRKLPCLGWGLHWCSRRGCGSWRLRVWLPSSLPFMHAVGWLGVMGGAGGERVCGLVGGCLFACFVVSKRVWVRGLGGWFLGYFGVGHGYCCFFTQCSLVDHAFGD
ncbi:uncharacterized protein B0H64DRAFT_210614 [Chaetomium fimeti]|uniref:Secreted protein n=1 Tax=Chaetomium fimeti TaxID=1854472 RepID=A0AAE0HB59_9PEZI|nr:hypothetical protein B0H64DRAFT_210614 [Chaetomium fimeti]